MKQQFVVTHTINQTEIPSLLDSCVTNRPSLKILYKKYFLYFRKNMTRLNVGLLRICQVFSFSCKIVYRWHTRICSFMSDMRNVVWPTISFRERHGANTVWARLQSGSWTCSRQGTLNECNSIPHQKTFSLPTSLAIVPTQILQISILFNKLHTLFPAPRNTFSCLEKCPHKSTCVKIPNSSNLLSPNKIPS